MSGVLVWGGLGLLVGMAVQQCGFSLPENVGGAATFRSGTGARCVLYLLGIGMVLCAALSYLAVIDVDEVEVVPLSGGTVLGGVLFGLAVGLAGLLPATSLTGLGGGRLLESLCGVVGCVGGAWLGTVLPLEGIRGLVPRVDATLFRLTLRDGYLLQGGFAGLACLGLLLCALALLVPLRRDAAAPPVDVPDVPAEPVAPADAKPGDNPDADPEQLPTETFVALLPEEEPMVVDTAAPEQPAETDAEKEEKPMDPRDRRTPPATDTEPILQDHPELEEPVDLAPNRMAQLAALETQAGLLTPTEELDMPAPARAPERMVPDELLDDAAPENGVGEEEPEA